MTEREHDHQAKPIRVLHVVGQMSRGGIETWLMHLLRRVDQRRVSMDIVVCTNARGDYDEELHSLGVRLIGCTGHTRPWQYARKLSRVLRTHGPYDVVHSHIGYYSGLVMLVARMAGVPARIAHSHNTRHSPLNASPLRRLYERACCYLIRRCATLGLAPSQAAAIPLFGLDWAKDGRWRVLHYGIDLEPFETLPSPDLRAEFGFSRDSLVIGHVGRFAPQKNHSFLIEIFSRIAKDRPDARLLLVGDGPLRASIERQVEMANLANKVVFAGIRSDIPAVMAIMDAFVLPSHHEGLGLVALEAQAAGVPTIMSTEVPAEASAIRELSQWLSLGESADVWAAAILQKVARRSQESSFKLALARLRNGEFDVNVAMGSLMLIYERSLNDERA